MRDYKKIDAWKLADDLTVRVYRVTAGFPREEIFGMVSQLRRAAYWLSIISSGPLVL